MAETTGEKIRQKIFLEALLLEKTKYLTRNQWQRNFIIPFY